MLGNSFQDWRKDLAYPCGLDEMGFRSSSGQLDMMLLPSKKNVSPFRPSSKSRKCWHPDMRKPNKSYVTKHARARVHTHNTPRTVNRLQVPEDPALLSVILKLSMPPSVDTVTVDTVHCQDMLFPFSSPIYLLWVLPSTSNRSQQSRESGKWSLQVSSHGILESGKHQSRDQINSITWHSFWGQLLCELRSGVPIHKIAVVIIRTS